MSTAIQSARVTNIINSPQVLDATYQRGKPTYDIEQLVVATTSLTVNSTIDVVPIPSGATIDSLVIYNDQLDSNVSATLTLDIGLITLETFYDVSEDTNITSGATKYAANAAVGSASLLVSASTVLQSANTTGVQLRHQVLTLDKAQKRLWELASLAADPRKLFALRLKMHAAAATAVQGNVVLKVEYRPG